MEGVLFDTEGLGGLWQPVRVQLPPAGAGQDQRDWTTSTVAPFCVLTKLCTGVAQLWCARLRSEIALSRSLLGRAV
jgi:hypothetical protein